MPDPGMAQMGQAVNPRGSAYPDTSEMNMNEPMQEKPDTNPVVSALDTIAKFVATQEQQGNPNVEAMKQHLGAFMKAVVDSSAQPGAEGAMPGRPAPQGAPDEQVQVKDPFAEEKAMPAMKRKRNMNTSIQPMI